MTDDAELNHLFINDVSLIDVRAPVEFGKGAFPASVNLPILQDVEREKVGICYRHEGPNAARDLGYQLVSGRTREDRIAAWTRHAMEHPEAQLYCFRGGQRSGIACEWLAATGLDVPRIEGGYKRMRGYLLDVFSDLPDLMIVAGKTGTGKTRFLEPFPLAIDLEAIARHRGSAFGGRIDNQPCQVDFENALAVEFLKRKSQSFVLLEDEGRLIGRIHVPLPLQERMREAPLLLIEEPVSARASLIFDEYIVRQWTDYAEHFGERAFEQFTDYLLTAVDAIRKRLGNVAHGEIRGLIEAALQRQRSGDLSHHRQWIERLLVDYYDPMYEYQLEKKLARVKVRGTREELSGWLKQRLAE